MRPIRFACRVFTAAALLLAADAATICARADMPDVLDTSDFIAPGFSTDFGAPLKLRQGRVTIEGPKPLTDPNFTWTAGYIHTKPVEGEAGRGPGKAWFPAFSTLHDELELYPNAQAIALLHASPFSISGGVLTITADRFPEAARVLIPAPLATNARYLSGALVSYPFSQEYGYFEIRAKLPAGNGLWPAFWLLPMSGKWPPEIDVFEVLGHDPTTLYTTVHTQEDGHHRYWGKPTKGPDLSRDFHLFGVDWGPRETGFYLDRHLVFSTRTPADWHMPFYLLLNLGVSAGGWAGKPDATTQFPAREEIAYVRAWQRKAYLERDK